MSLLLTKPPLGLDDAPIGLIGVEAVPRALEEESGMVRLPVAPDPSNLSLSP
ncbi:hypothetical protein ACIQRJ_34300 [Streptomyces niveus]|uniref:hypothetical protein n=1 Tax=Streptomyces niveus TaxID=193462 RepID=UPI00383536EE